MNPVLETQDLTIRFGGHVAVDRVSCAFHAGTLTAIVGPNGAGKTTLMNTLSGLVERTGGEILLDGEPVHAIPAQRRVARGLIQCPEGRRLFPEMTVAENLRMGAYMCRSAPEIRRRQEMVEGIFPILRERRDQIASSMSGGQQQMVAIGRALMAAPRVLLLDEPSLGLAPIMVAEMFRAIERIRGEGMTLLIVEQNVQQTLQASDRAYVLENGAIVLHGPAGEMLDNPHMKAAYLGTH